MEIGVPVRVCYSIIMSIKEKFEPHNKKGEGISHLPSKFSSQIEEWLLKIVITLGRDLIILQILLPMECDHLSLNLPVLHINLVATENNWNILTNPNGHRSQN